MSTREGYRSDSLCTNTKVEGCIQLLIVVVTYAGQQQPYVGLQHTTAQEQHATDELYTVSQKCSHF